MRRLFAVARDLTGNLPPLPDVFPGQLAPTVRIAGGERQLEMMRWGMPGPPQFGGAPVTNIRNQEPALARLAQPGASLPRPGQFVLRMGRHLGEHVSNAIAYRREVRLVHWLGETPEPLSKGRKQPQERQKAVGCR